MNKRGAVTLASLIAIALLVAFPLAHGVNNAMHSDLFSKSNESSAKTVSAPTTTGSSVKPVASTTRSASSGAAKPSAKSASTTPPPLPDLSKVLKNNTLIDMLPADGIILLKTYHYNINTRVWDQTYILRKGNITKGTAKADLALILDSSYVRQLNNGNLCDVVKKAKAAGSLGMELYLSDFSLTWKYKGMMGQKACFGI